MKPELRGHFDAELAAAIAAERNGNTANAWGHLERAHILSQAHAWPHIRVHGRMFAFAWRRRDVREILAQIPRLILAGPGSLFGRAPLGNTGGSSVGIFTPMPVPDDLKRLLDQR